MRSFNTVAIIGVGLIGGSIGLALRERKLAQRIIGIGRRKESLDQALAIGCATEITTSIADGVKDADLVVVCTPVDSIAGHVVEAGRHCREGCLITDAGSTKTDIVVQAEAGLSERFGKRLPFVGSHPIAGSEKNGPQAASGDLFSGRVVVVTPTAASGSANVAAVEEFWRSLGARVVRMSPPDHDAAMAHVSHLPHVLAAALAAATPDELLPLAGTGWADTTRIAAGNPELWRQIFQANRGPTLKALADFETVLMTWRNALENADGMLLLKLLQEGKRRRDAVGS
jgi:prephenate dehydrogenase